nr:putative zinc-binding protein [uncultured Caproiciproducens sp.]
MADNELKIGIVSCSGEDCLGGTISRLATRKMLEERADGAVTICLPLYLAGGEEERGFAEEYPTIAVDGCSKCCAKRATEKYSGKVSCAIDVSDIIGKEAAESGALSTRALNDDHREMVDKVAIEIKTKIDEILKTDTEGKSNGKKSDCGCGCSCGCS